MADNESVEIVLKGKFENGQLIIDTTKSIQKGIKDIGDESKEAEKKGSMLTDTLKRLAAIVGITALANQFKTLVKGSLEAAGAMEQVDIALTTMLGSGEKAKKLTADLIAFAKKTPFEIEGIFSSTKQLLAYGFAQEEILPTMSTLGNIAAGVGVDMNRLALAFGQVKTTGHLMGQDLNQFTQAGVPLLSALADVLGKTEAEVTKLKESGKISFEAVRVALESMTKEGGKFYNLMENQSKTFLGTVSNMSDSFYQVKVALGDALLPVAKQVVNAMITWFGELKTTIEKNKESITKFANAIVTAFSAIGTAVGVAWKFLSTFIDGLKWIFSNPIVQILAGGTAAFLAMAYGISILSGAFIFLTTTAAGWIVVIGLVVAALGVLTGNVENMPDVFKIAFLTIGKWFEELKFTVISAVEAILDSLGILSKLPFFGWVDDAKKSFAELKDSIIDNVHTIDDEISKIKAPQVAGAEVGAPSIPAIPAQGPLLAPEDSDKAEQKRLKALKEENEALLEEQKNFLEGYGANETEADKLVADNKTLRMQQQLLDTEEYQSRVSELQAQLLAGEITNEQYKAELLKTSNDAKNEALQIQYEAELAQFTEAQLLKDQITLEMQAVQNEAELAQLQLKLDTVTQKEQQSQQMLSQFKIQKAVETYEQKKKKEEDSLKHTLKMDSDGFKAAQGAANELVGLQNSKSKELAAIGKAAAIFQITVDTARGAMSAYASLAPIPIVGPALGIAAAGAVIAYGAEKVASASSASFAVGTPNIPQDQLANVHAGEMIVPATFAEAIRSGDLTLGSGGDYSGANSEQGATITNININFDGAQFVGQMNDEDIAVIGTRLGQLIAEDVIVAIPTRRAA